jgi:acetyl esterase/lipase
VISKAANVAVVSTEYRLAPENPFPSGEEDVFDVAEYLVDNAPNLYSGPLKFIGGESAGATLSMSTILHLLETRPKFRFAGAALMYGLYDWSLSPSVRTFTAPLIMTTKHVKHYGEAYLGKRSPQERRDPAISPIYHPIFKYPGSTLEPGAIGDGMKLPPALFLSGTKDATLDDTVLMSFRYQVAGGDARVKFVEGAPHAFLLFPADRFEMVARGRAILTEFLQEMMHEH